MMNSNTNIDSGKLSIRFNLDMFDENQNGRIAANCFGWGRFYITNPCGILTFTGIQSFPALGVLSDEEMDIIRNHPLAVVEVSGSWPSIKCKSVLLAEPKHGIDIHPYDKWIYRSNPPEQLQFRVFVTKFGEPLKNITVRLEPSCEAFGIRICYPRINYTDTAQTDEDGIATFNISTKDPQNPRGYIDGQLYRFVYYVKGLKPDYDTMQINNSGLFANSLMVMRVFNNYIPHSPPTWLDDIYPIFIQYANLYPVMKENFVDLGNYYDVLRQKTAILMSMKLPISNPNYMPLTRDLSDSKKKVIIEWLSRDAPLIGKSRDYYTIENLRKNLQTALEIELSTIPPYMTALASIKHNYNHDVKSIIKTILNQEMIHMTLAANILNAVGGTPRFYSKKVSPRYPTRLPGGVQPELVVPIEKLSIDLIRNVFMKIEEPEIGLQRQFEFKHTFDFVDRMKGSKSNHHLKRGKRDIVPDAGVDEDLFPCFDINIRKELHKAIFGR
ncbi:hypothetical protein QZH41_002492 [Actinostola sp. cb2023]|nr:hypothetical protein QZH41_002492 [Actinostola sp. cb2023]